jgi:hypothetical protein
LTRRRGLTILPSTNRSPAANFSNRPSMRRWLLTVEADKWTRAWVR